MAYSALTDIARLKGIQGLPPLQQGKTGWWVRLLQRALNEVGYKCTVDGDYGPHTALAVRDMQHDFGLLQDGMVGQQTWAFLAEYDEDNPPVSASLPIPVEADRFADKITMSMRRNRIVIIARAFLAAGVREQGNNRGEMVDAFNQHAIGMVGQPWCVTFCDFVVDNAYEGTGRRPPFDVGASSSKLVRNARKHGLLRDPRGPRAGDLFVVPGGPTGYKHTGLVNGVEGENILTIEGNTDGSGTNEGQGIYGLRRNPMHQRLVIVSVTD